MKTLLMVTLLALATYSGVPLPQASEHQLLEMHVNENEVFENRIKIFDYQGNLVKEMKAADVANSEISITDYLFLESSDFAFKYQGDYFYFR